MCSQKYYTDVAQLRRLAPAERERLQRVTELYSFRATDHYLSLIDWEDPADPIRRIIVPSLDELDCDGVLDPSNERANYVAPGCQHKYPHTALLICTETCAAYCRYCFRKRIFMDDSEVERNLDGAFDYIAGNKRITNVLLTGGDPLTLSTRRLEEIMRRLREIDHVDLIRIGSKVLAFNPYRVLDDPDLLRMLSRYSTARKRIYIITHFDVVNELADATRRAIAKLLRSGVVLANQCPITRGVNDSPERIGALMHELAKVGIPQYYFFQCRPTAGNKPYAVPIAEGYRALDGARRHVSGLVKRSRFVMSHALGKIEIVGVTSQHMYLRFHRARYAEHEGRFMVFHRDDRAYWLDDLRPADGRRHPVRDRIESLTPRIRTRPRGSVSARFMT